MPQYFSSTSSLSHPWSAVPAKMTLQPLLAKSETWLPSAGTSGWVSWPCQLPRTCPLTLVPPPWRHAHSPAMLWVQGIRVWRTEITLTPSPNMVAAAHRPNPSVTPAHASVPHPLTAEELLRHLHSHPLTHSPNTQRRKMVRNVFCGEYFLNRNVFFSSWHVFFSLSLQQPWRNLTLERLEQRRCLL